MTDIVRVLKDRNLGLQKVELYSNQVGELGQADEWKQELKSLLLRNQYLKTQKEKEALVLLVAARATLLPSKFQRDPQTHPPSRPHIRSGSVSLPTELYLYILSFLAPNLSSSQRIRIYTYASTFDTLPPLLPRLSSRNDIIRYPPGPPRSDAFIRSNLNKAGCLDGCIRGVVCQREVKRERWLKVVGCDTYEHDPEGD